MYQTIDEINNGAFFWRSVVGPWPTPFCSDDVDAFALAFADGVMLVICWDSEAGTDRRRLLRLMQGQSDVLLEVILTEQWDYVRGDSLGMAVDELAAVSALHVFACEPDGNWYVPDVEVESEGTNV